MRHVQYLSIVQVVAGDIFGSGVAASLIISISDVNDNRPVFSQIAYNFTVDENAYNKVLGRVTATDVDTDPETVYRIVGDAGPFILDSDSGMFDDPSISAHWL